MKSRSQVIPQGRRCHHWQWWCLHPHASSPLPAPVVVATYHQSMSHLTASLRRVTHRESLRCWRVLGAAAPAAGGSGGACTARLVLPWALANIGVSRCISTLQSLQALGEWISRMPAQAQPAASAMGRSRFLGMGIVSRGDRLFH